MRQEWRQLPLCLRQTTSQCYSLCGAGACAFPAVLRRRDNTVQPTTHSCDWVYLSLLEIQVPNFSDQIVLHGDLGKNMANRGLSHPLCEYNLATITCGWSLISVNLKTVQSNCSVMRGLCRVWLTAGSTMETHFKFLCDITSVETHVFQLRGKVRFLFTESISDFLCVQVCRTPSLRNLLILSLPPPTRLPLSRAGVGGNHSLMRQSQQSLSYC